MIDLFTYKPTARELADEGMQRAVQHADAAEPEWSARALNLVREYALSHREFMAEDVRTWAHKERGLELPPTPRAWGAVIVRAKAARLISHGGYRATSIPPAHASPRAVWLSSAFQ